MIVPIFHFGYNKKIYVLFKRKVINFVVDMQSFHCEKFVLWTSVNKVPNTVNFVVREA